MATIAITLTDICNLALATLGDREITNYETDTDQLAKRCQRLLPEIIRQVQHDIQWENLTVFISPVKITDEYNGVPGLYQYPLPNNFLDIISVDVVTSATTGVVLRETDTWKLEGQYLISPVEDAFVAYKAYSESVADWDGYLVELVYRKLAQELAMPITNNPGIEQRAEHRYEKAWHKIVTKKQNRARYEEKKRVWFNMLSARNTSGTYN